MSTHQDGDPHAEKSRVVGSGYTLLVRTFFALVVASFPVQAQVLQTLDLSATRGSQSFYEDDARKMSSIEAWGFIPRTIRSNAAP